MKKELRNIAFIVAAAILMAFNISNFARVGGLLPGGFTGVALLIQKILQEYAGVNVAYSIIYIPFNAVPAVISFLYIGKRFTIKSVIMIILSAVLSDFIPNLGITSDLMLCSIFGGILNGIAIGLCLISNATSGGTDFISIFFSKRYGRDAWGYIFIANVLVLVVAGFLFGLEGAMYSIILQFISTAMIQNIYKKYQKHTLCIITDHPDEVYKVIVNVSHHDGTLFRGVGMYEGKERNMIYSVVGSDEVTQVIHEVRRTDEKAFINILKSTQVHGNFYQKPMD